MVVIGLGKNLLFKSVLAKKLFLGLNSSSGSCELVEDFPVPREDSTKVLTAFYYNQIKEGKK